MPNRRRELRAHYIGRIAYDEALQLQRRLVEQRHRGDIGDTMLLLEHPPTVTLGRGAKAENLLISREGFAEQGIEVHEVGRGGDVTYHGPGQLVAYPIIDLNPDRMDVRKYVSTLEETMIRLAADHGLKAERIETFNGTWMHADSDRPLKIGAVGVRISRWVTMHGLAFNVRPDLGHFGLIVPCGLTGKGVTSLQNELPKGAPPGLEDVAKRAAEHFARIHESELEFTLGPP
ncbi:MAG: lipoyl(octanoyl) transferase LipB [Myxococcota bacterium]